MLYNYRIRANANFNWSLVNAPPTDFRTRRFTVLLWAGQDDEGWCVFKEDPATGDILRIDFYPPMW
jgi:hypothetical protein